MKGYNSAFRFGSIYAKLRFAESSKRVACKQEEDDRGVLDFLEACMHNVILEQTSILEAFDIHCFSQ